MKSFTFAALGLAAVSLAACEDTMDSSMMEGTGAAQTACISAVNERNVVGAGEAGASVTGAEFSEAGSMVQLIDGNGTRWQCLASNDGAVEELNIM